MRTIVRYGNNPQIKVYYEYEFFKYEKLHKENPIHR